MSTGYDYATQVAYNPATHFAYITNWDDGAGASITQIDTITGAGASIALCSGASAPLGITVDPANNTVYTANFGTGAGATVSVFSGATDVNGTVTNAACTANITGLPAAPYIVNVNTVTGVLYVASYGAGSVTAINTGNNSVINTVTGLTASSIRALAIDPVTNYVYVAYGTTAPRVASFSGATTGGISMALHATITTNQDYPSMLSVDPVTNEVYVADCAYLCSNKGQSAQTSTSYFAGNSATGTAKSTTTAGGTEVYNVAVNPVSNVVYWGNWDSQTFNSAPGASNGATIGTETDAAATNYQWEMVEDSTHNLEFYTAGANGSDWYAVSSADAKISTIAAQGADPISLALDPITSRVVMADWGATNATPGYANAYTLGAGVATGTSPAALAVNPVSGNVYVANSGSGTVSAYTSALASLIGSPIAVGSTPVSVAVDPVTGTVYVANKGSNSLTVIDETATDANATATIAVGASPVAVAVNPVTNRVYVANNTGNSVSIYNENTGTVSTVALSPATSPYALAIDQGNNTVYVADANGYVSVINGSSGALTATLTTGSQTGASNPQAIAVNPANHAVYIANAGAAIVTYLSGCPSACAAGTLALSNGGNALAVAVNPASGDVYVAQASGFGVISNNVYEGSFTSGLCTTPSAVAMNTFSNLAFMLCSGSATNAINAWDATGLHAGSAARFTASPSSTPVAGGIAVNNATQTAYVLTAGNLIYAYTLTYPQSSALAADFPTSIAGSTADPDYVANDALYATTDASPQFTVTAASNAYANQAQNIPVTAVYYAVDNPSGLWTAVTSAATGAGTNSTTWKVTPTNVSTGVHTLYVFATYGDENGATTNGIFNDVAESSALYQASGTDPNVGPIVFLPFVELAGAADTTTSLTVNSNPAAIGAPVTYTATITPASGSVPTSDSVTFFDGVTAVGTATPLTASGTNVTAALTLTYSAAGTHYITAVFSGDSAYTWSESAVLTEVINAGTAPSDSLTSVSTPYATPVTVTATSNASGSVVTFSVTPSTLGAFSPATCVIGASPQTTCATTFTPAAAATPGLYSNALVASFAAAGDYTGGSASASLVVTHQATTTAVISVAPASVSYGSGTASTVTATLNYSGSGSPPSGNLTLANTAGGSFGATNCGAPANDVITCTALFTPNSTDNAGNYVITASYAGDTNYSGSASPGSPNNYAITQAAATLAVSGSGCGATSGGVTSCALTATLNPATPGATVTFSDATNGTAVGKAMTSSGGTAQLTVTTGTAGVSAGKNLFSASVAATSNTSAAATTSNATAYISGILFSFVGAHNFSGLLTGNADPYSCCSAGVEGTVDGTTAAAYGVGVYNFTSSAQTLPVTLTNAASGAFSLSNQCGATLSAGELCTLVFDYAPPSGDGCTPAEPLTGSSCTADGAGYPQGVYESATWSYTLPNGVLAGLGNQGFTTSGTAAASGTLAGKALLAPLSLTLSTATAAFGAVAQNATSQTITLTVKNSNNASVSYTYTPPSSGSFTAANTCSSPLAAGASCSIYLTMVTSATGTFSDALTLNPAGGTAATVNISGTVAAASSGITLSSNNHNFGSVTDGTSVSYSTTLTNNTPGTATLAFSNSAGSGFTTRTNCGASLARAASCTYVFTFAPAAAGASADTLTITSNVPILPSSAGGDTGTVTVSGTGIAGGNLTATSVVHNWGSVPVGNNGGNYGVEITNSTGSAVTLSFSGLTGGAGGFSLMGSSCGTSLAVNANCEMVFNFTPTGTGAVSGTYPITSSAPLYFNGSPVNPAQITLEGTGQ